MRWLFRGIRYGAGALKWFTASSLAGTGYYFFEKYVKGK